MKSLLVEKFEYRGLSRDESSGSRMYKCADGMKVPSVTTILSATKSEESAAALLAWKKRVGETEAARVTRNASDRGTLMHAFIEDYIAGKWHPEPCPASNLLEHQASKMAIEIIKNGLSLVSEVWGSEVSLYYPEIYAGTTDCVGLYDGRPAIVDFKQSNKPKRREWIDDYFVQTVMYGNAHNILYNTEIKTGVVMIAVAPPENDPLSDPTYQDFVIRDRVWDYYTNIMWDRLEKYYG